MSLKGSIARATFLRRKTDARLSVQATGNFGLVFPARPMFHPGMKPLACLLLALVVPLHAATPEKGKAELRKLVKLPTLNLSMAFGLSTERGFALTEPKPQKEKKAAALQKRIDREPRNGSLRLELCELLNALGRKTESKAALKMAVELLRKEAEARAGDAAAVAGFARALAESDEQGEAERLLRAAVARSTNEWMLWVTLGDVLSQRATTTLVYGDEGKREPGRDGESFIRAVLQRKPGADEIQRVEELRVESARCFDRAVQLAPKSSEVYLQRAGFKSLNGMLRTLVEELRKPESNVKRTWSAFFNREALKDFQKAAELSPTNYLMIGTAAVLEAFAVMYEQAGPAATLDYEAMTISRLPPAARAVIRDAMTRLENLGEHPDRAIAAGALELLGGLQFIVAQDPEGARKTLRRTVTLDPSRHQAWEILIGVTYTMEKPDLLVAVCAERLKALDNSRNRLLLAKAYDTAGNGAKAKETVESALKATPDDPLLLLASAALQLRTAQTSRESQAAGESLMRVREKIEALPENDRETLVIDAMLLNAIQLGLDDEPEEARKLVRLVLKKDPEHERAQKILAALVF